VKHCIVILDGASGWPLEELGGLTTLAAARTPNLTALAMAGKMQPDVRLPLCEMSEDNARRLRTTLEQLGLIAK
jgi:hypothetical protein